MTIGAFIDTGYILALEIASDRYHGQALGHWKSFTRTPFTLVTTSYVFDEVVTFLSSRGRHDRAVATGKRLLESSAIELIDVDRGLFLAGWQYFQHHADKSYSLTDCISFVVMQQRGITRALTFDRHFQQAGFQKLPRSPMQS